MTFGRLDVQCIDTASQAVDWRAEGWEEYDDGGRWAVVLPPTVECPACDDGDDGDGAGSCDMCDGTGAVPVEEAQDGDPDLGFPMMDSAYPLDSGREYGPDDAARLAHLPLTIVRDVDRDLCYLALTGGGMDLSWEIAEGYCRLGHLPPAWVELPAMCGRGASATDRAIAEAQLASYEILARWMGGRAEGVRRALEFAAAEASSQAGRDAQGG